jgi:hypothetical protein
MFVDSRKRFSVRFYFVVEITVDSLYRVEVLMLANVKSMLFRLRNVGLSPNYTVFQCRIPSLSCIRVLQQRLFLPYDSYYDFFSESDYHSPHECIFRKNDYSSLTNFTKILLPILSTVDTMNTHSVTMSVPVS